MSPSSTTSSSSGATPPSSILIIGSGIFGLTTALALAERPKYARTTITVLDPHPVLPTSHVSTTASIDTTRIVRADYADVRYAKLAQEAQVLWRTEHWGGQGRYNESGLCLTADVGGKAYVQEALANVRNLEREHNASRDRGHGGRDSDDIQELSSPADIAASLSCGDAATGSGVSGYLNKASGWAHAENCMRHLRSLVDATERVRFVVGTATRLIFDQGSNRVTGTELLGGEVMEAEVTIVAAGSWTPGLVDLRGVASARAQCVGYMDLTKEEAAPLKNLPVVYNMESGCFCFTPNAKDDDGEEWEVKVAQHTFGYTNPVEFRAPLGAAEDEERITASLPVFPTEGIPPADKARLEKFMMETMPILRKNGGKDVKKRGLSRSRLCYYLDTASSDWLVCPYPLPQTTSRSTSAQSPAYPSLFLATGGSGHAFKFMPVLGDRVVDVLEGTDWLPERSGGLWTRKWAWPGKKGSLRTDAEAVGVKSNVKRKAANISKKDDGEVWCMDGSRGGTVGLRLAEAYDVKGKKREHQL